MARTATRRLLTTGLVCKEVSPWNYVVERQSSIPVSFRLTRRLASQVPNDAPNGETACAESIKRMSSKNIFHYPLYHASRK